MKPWPSTDRSGPDRAAGREYLGRTPEEALARASAALGSSAELRCWKTRRGGVGGFFATEVYVASSTPPRGAESPHGRARRKPTDGTTRARQSSGTLEQAGEAGPSPTPDLDDPDPLTTLAEGTADQVSIHNPVLPAAAFDALLAEAEAALGHDGTLSAGSPGASPAPSILPAVAPPVAPPVAPADPIPAAADRAHATGLANPPSEPERIPNLRERLRALGVPDAFLPQGGRPTLDALANALDGIPGVPALVAAPGDIVLVVGSEDLVPLTADVLLGALGLGRRDVVRCSVSGHSDGEGAARIGTVKVNAAVRVAKRRAGGRASLVALATPSGTEGAAAAADVIDCLRPHLVLAAVDASHKRADVDRWLQELGAADALAVWGLDRTRTPGELLGAAPIAYADGTACTAVTWTATLLTHLAEDGAA